MGYGVWGMGYGVWGNIVHVWGETCPTWLIPALIIDHSHNT